MMKIKICEMRKALKCCDPERCKLKKPEYVCSVESCCDDCQIVRLLKIFDKIIVGTKKYMSNVF